MAGRCLHWFWLHAAIIGASSSEIRLGYLYIHAGPSDGRESDSWVVESFSHFKLGIQDVNADPNILPNHVLNFTNIDTTGSELPALQGAEDLIELGVAGIVGTGYSGALKAPSVYCSMKKVPIISPGSGFVELVDKARFPFLLRSIASDAIVLKSLAVATRYLGFEHAAVLTSSYREGGVVQVLRPAVEAMGISFLQVVYPEGPDGPEPARTMQALELIKSAGYRVVILQSKTTDMAFLDTATRAVGLRDSRYVYLMASAAFVGVWTTANNTLSTGTESDSDNALAAAHRTRWPSVSTRWDASVHGWFDPATKMPFYDRTTVWDTDYAARGDQLPDIYGMYVYDTVWLYARALDALIREGGDPLNGEALREKLLMSNMNGVTGTIQFDRDSQDRVPSTKIMMARPDGTPLELARTTAAMSQGSPKDGVGNWCPQQPDGGGCLDFTHAVFGSIPWAGGVGKTPTDGRKFDVEKSIAFLPDSAIRGDDIAIQIAASNSFGAFPCAAKCTDANASECQSCRDQFLNINKLVIEFALVSRTPAVPVEGVAPPTYLISQASSRMSIVFPGGLNGIGTEDEEVSVVVKYDGDPVRIDGSGAMSLISDACPVGTAQNDGAVPRCTPCNPGTYNPTRGAPTCTPCPAGTHQPKFGNNLCQDCQAGQFTAEPGKDKCDLCQIGEFQPNEGEDSCLPCNDTEVTKILGATAPEECTCASGTYRKVGELPCAACEEGISCVVGSKESNLLLAIQGKADAGDRPQLQPGYWAAPEEPFSVFRCANDARCVGGDPGDSSCGGNLIGRACAHCKDQFYWSGSECRSCTSFQASTVLFVTIPLAAGVVALLVLYKSSGDGIEKWGSWRNSLTCLAVVCLNHYQVIGLLSETDVAMPKTTDDTYSSWSFANDMTALFNRACVGVDDIGSRTIVSALTPVLLFVLTCAVYVGSKAVSAVSHQPHLALDPNRLCNVFFSILFTFSTAIVDMSLKLFKWRGNPNGEQSVAADLSMVVSSDSWNTLVGVAVVCILLYVVLCGIVYVRAVMQALIGDAFKDPSFRARWKFLFLKFRPDVGWFALAFLGKNVALNLGSVFFVVGVAQIYWIMTVATVYAGLIILYSPYRWIVVNYLELYVSFSIIYCAAILTWFADDRKSISLDRALEMTSVFISFTPLAIGVGVALVTVYRGHVGADLAEQKLRNDAKVVQMNFKTLQHMDERALALLYISFTEWDRHFLMKASTMLEVEVLGRHTKKRMSARSSASIDSKSSGQGGADNFTVSEDLHQRPNPFSTPAHATVDAEEKHLQDVQAEFVVDAVEVPMDEADGMRNHTNGDVEGADLEKPDSIPPPREDICFPEEVAVLHRPGAAIEVTKTHAPSGLSTSDQTQVSV